MVETTSRMASSSSTTSMFSISTIGWLPEVFFPSCHYEGQHINKLGLLPIQKTPCSFTDKYSRGCQASWFELYVCVWKSPERPAQRRRKVFVNQGLLAIAFFEVTAL